jgi:hypothetical protein
MGISHLAYFIKKLRCTDNPLKNELQILLHFKWALSFSTNEKFEGGRGHLFLNLI